MRTTLLTCVCLSVICSTLSADENWPRFRGPRGDGHAEASNLPLTWSETENVRWKTPLPGKAWSSPVVWGDQIWLTNAPEDGKQLSAVCVDRATGRVVHNVVVFQIEEPQYCHPVNSYASPTPVIEAGRLYVHYGSHGTACLDTATAKVLWTRQDLPCNHHRGAGSSPLLYEGLVILTFDGFDQQYVVALDKQTGDTLWKADRETKFSSDNGDIMKAYGTPVVLPIGGRPLLVGTAAEVTVALDPLSGEEQWRVHHGGMNAATPPLWGDGLLYINSCAGGLGLAALRPEGQGILPQEQFAWTSKLGIPKRSGPLLIDGLITMANAGGVATCLDARTGEKVWQQRIGAKVWASPIYAEGRIYYFGSEGRMPVIQPGREFKLLAENRLDDGCMASPAVSGDALIVRTKTHLYCIGSK